MKNIEMAADYASKAKWCMSEAKLAFEKANHPICIRRSQEALELGVKAVLRYLGVEYPREHDVGDALPAVEGRVPNYLREKIPEIQKLLGELAGVRGPAMYGYEREGIPASEAFNAGYARDVFSKVNEVVELCVRFLEKSTE